MAAGLLSASAPPPPEPSPRARPLTRLHQVWRKSSFAQRRKLLRTLLKFIVNNVETICRSAPVTCGLPHTRLRVPLRVAPAAQPLLRSLHCSLPTIAEAGILAKATTQPTKAHATTRILRPSPSAPRCPTFVAACRLATAASPCWTQSWARLWSRARRSTGYATRARSGSSPSGALRGSWRVLSLPCLN